MDKLPPKQLLESIYQQLLPTLQIESINPRNPIKVSYLPQPWRLLGTGNYAAVVYHPDYPDSVVKIYAPGRPGYEEEVEVYRRLGSHPAFSECLYAKDCFLVLKRLYGTTLYDCLHLGLPIPKQVIRDIDKALDYAQSRGLYPHDVHGRNVMMHQGRGLVVDISDFLHQEACSKWKDLKKAYYWFYLPVLSPLRLRVPYSALDMSRKCYRLGTSFKTSCCQLVRRLGHFKYLNR
ncbi:MULTISPECIES: serine/threonine protein kinase [unclassified Anabaena]|uniref:serine/threonine protein kinase n=1 Tax=unclassified Anabaena TaxID=2619674 RepID=UPI0039C6D836